MKIHPRTKYYQGILLLVFLYSCNGWNSKEGGTILLSSEFNFDNATLMGYHFESGSYTSYPEAEGEVPDILLMGIRRVDGSEKPGFSSPENRYGIALAGNFNSGEEATSYFEDQLLKADTTLNLSDQTDTILINQVFILRTSAGNYVKLKVDDIQEVEDSYASHFEVWVEYVYQGNGSTSFVN